MEGYVNGPLTVKVEVATPNAEPAPSDEYTRRLLEAIGEVVDKPVPPPVPFMVIGDAARTLKVAQVIEPVQVTDVVATPETPFPPVEL